MTTAKGLAGGTPLSAVTGSAEIMDSAEPGALGGTYCGNPLACAAALATLDMIEEHDLLGRARTIGETGIRLMEQWKAKDPRIGEVRGKGAMMALELVDPDSQKPDAALTAAVAQAARSRGLILLTCGTYGNVIRLLPPVTMPDELFAEGMEILEQALRDQP